MRYVCIHGHFYQPPRDNPWLEAVELQDSAYPYHDWNARVDAECYSRNAASRILDEQRRIRTIVNNFASISFNVGPTLLSWLEQHSPDTYAGILAGDRLSQAKFDGHGSAMSQPYNHMIMPLATRRDKETQVRWGIRDFERRFGRKPVGMWLPETAVDLETLEVLAQHEIRFTVLSPHQADAVRPLAVEGKPPTAEAPWTEVRGGRVDPTRAYVQRLASGRSIAIFYYDGPVSQAVAFEQLLHRGEAFAERIVTGFSDERDWPQLMHIATDGESYGHHHRDGDMALAYALDYIEQQDLAELTNYACYLERCPPAQETRIIENTAWSCSHGLGRWSEDCGCHTGGHAGWNQAWRAPLRAALDWLRDTLADIYTEAAADLLKDCWAARDDYIDVILDRSDESVAAFLDRHSHGDTGERTRVRRLELLEMQRHAMLMYTSCGWFFDEVSGIESTQVIAYAARALQLAERASGRQLEGEFLERLAAAKSNLPQHRDAGAIYQNLIKPAMLDVARVGAHYAVSSLFADYPEQARIYCYVVTREREAVNEVGTLAFRAGRATIHDTITLDDSEIGYAAAHLGNYNIAAGVLAGMAPDDWQRILDDIDAAFRVADIAEIVRRIDRCFRGNNYSIRSLFRDEQRKVVGDLLKETLEEVEATYLDIHQRHARLGLLLAELGIPIPTPLRRADERAINHQLEAVLAADAIDLDRIGLLLEDARRRNTELDQTRLEFTLRATLKSIAEELERSPDEPDCLERLEAAVQAMEALPFEVNLWRVQNAYFRVLQERIRARGQDGPPGSPADGWAERFLALGPKLGVAVE